MTDLENTLQPFYTLLKLTRSSFQEPFVETNTQWPRCVSSQVPVTHPPPPLLSPNGVIRIRTFWEQRDGS
jgi:hypothetical protein